MSHQSPRKVLFAAALFGLSLPVCQATAATPAHSGISPRTRPAARHESGAVLHGPWHELLAFLGLASQAPPPNFPQAGCEIDPDGKCRIPPNPPTGTP